MRKIFASAIAALAIVGGLLAAPLSPAQASETGVTTYTVHTRPATSNGSWFKSFTCTSDGSFISFYINETVTGVGNSDPNTASVDQFGWSSSPAAKFNRLSLYMDSDGNGGHDEAVLTVGGSDSTKDDVPSSYTSPTSPGAYTGVWANGTNGELQFKAYGGVGSNNGSCTDSELP